MIHAPRESVLFYFDVNSFKGLKCQPIFLPRMLRNSAFTPISRSLSQKRRHASFFCTSNPESRARCPRGQSLDTFANSLSRHLDRPEEISQPGVPAGFLSLVGMAVQSHYLRVYHVSVQEPVHREWTHDVHPILRQPMPVPGCERSKNPLHPCRSRAEYICG